MSDEQQSPQEFHVEGTVEAVQPAQEPAAQQWAPDQVPARDPDPVRGPADPADVNLETPQDAQDNPNAEHPAAESHFNESPPEQPHAEGPEAGHESDSEVAQQVATQARMPSHQPAVDQAANSESDKLPPQPIKVDGRSRRSDDDALEGGWVDVVDGPHAGRFGSFVKVLQHALDGYPKQILVKTRDAENELLSIAYDHVRPSARTGGR